MSLLGADMMDEPTSIGLFVLLTVGLALGAIAAMPLVLRRLGLRSSIPALAIVGPVLAIVGAVLGSGAMSLSGSDIGSVLIVAGITGVAATIVGWRVARPLAADLAVVADAVADLSEGRLDRRTELHRHDEVGLLAARVDRLAATLQRTEAERAAADDERAAVVSALSHDLRTPLASLLASVDALDDGVADPATHLRAMRHNVLALEHLVDDLFLLARADAGALSLQADRLDLTELIDEAVEAIGPTAADAGVGLAVAIDRPVIVDGDAQALGRVLRNLLDNAVRHTPPSTTVTVELVDDGDPARIDVVDEGPGFDPDFVPRAVERFTRADDARSTSGAGLGLAIAQTMLVAHDGRLEVHPGPGGRVSVVLPTVLSPAASGA